MILCLLTWEIFQWALIHNIVLRATHIIGKRNVLADKLFRGRSVIQLTDLLSESGYCKTLISDIRPPKYRPICDLREQEPQVYYSPFPIEGAFATDALSVNWTGMYADSFP